MPKLKPDPPEDPRPPQSCPERFPCDDVECEGKPSKTNLQLPKLPERAYEAVLENSITLSPQWLLAKTKRSKKSPSAPTEEQSAPSILSTEESIRPPQRHKCCLDGPQKKVDRIRGWQDEERETVIPGRRDSKKKGQRLCENLKDNMKFSHKNEARWDSKWSRKQCLEGKEKEVLIKKEMDAGKVPTTKRHSFITLASEPKIDFNRWKSRNYQDSHSTVINHAVSGVGSGRLKASRGFSLGRGGTGFIRGPSPNMCSIGPNHMEKSKDGIGMSDPSVGKFCYPRGKLLDIYRKHMVYPSVTHIPGGLEEVLEITQPRSVEPLAFIAPDGEEKAILEEIWEAKRNSSGSLSELVRENEGQDNAEANAGSEGLIASEKKIATLPSVSNVEKTEPSPAATVQTILEDKYPSIEEDGGGEIALLQNTHVRELGFNRVDSESKLSEDSFDNNHAHAEASELVVSSKLKGAEQAVDVCRYQKEKDNGHQFASKTGQVRQLQPVPPPEKLSYLYRDPQGAIAACASLLGDKQGTPNALSYASVVGYARTDSRTNSLSTLKAVQNPLDAGHISCMEQGPSKFQKQQVQQQNVQFINPRPSPCSRLNGSSKDHLSGGTVPHVNSAVQQQVGQPSSNFEHLPVQHYQQVLEQLQQEFHECQMLLQQQHSEAQPLTCDKLHQQEMHDHLPDFGHSKMSSLREPNCLNQGHEQLLYDLQLEQQKWYNCYSGLEVLQHLQEKYGSIDPIHHQAQLDLLAHANQGVQQTNEKNFLKGQQHKMKLLSGHQQHLNKFQQDLETKFNYAEQLGQQQFQLDEESQYTLKHRPSSQSSRIFQNGLMSEGFRQLDKYQHKRHTPSFEQPPIIKQKLQSHEQLKQAGYFDQPNSVSFRRTSLPDASFGLHMYMNQLANSLAGEVEDLASFGHHMYMNPLDNSLAGEVEDLASFHLHTYKNQLANSLAVEVEDLDVLKQHGSLETLISRNNLHEDLQSPPTQPHISQLSSTGGYVWSEHDDQLLNGPSESQFYQPCHKAKKKGLNSEIYQMHHDSWIPSVRNDEFSKRAIMDMLYQRYGICPSLPLEKSGDGGGSLLSSCQENGPARNAPTLPFDYESVLDPSLPKVPYSSSLSNMAGVRDQSTACVKDKEGSNKQEFQIEMENVALESDWMQQARTTCREIERNTHVRHASVGAKLGISNVVGMESGHGCNINTTWSRIVQGSASIQDSSELASAFTSIPNDSRFVAEAPNGPSLPKPSYDMTDGAADESADARHADTIQKKKNKRKPIDPALLGFKVSSHRIWKRKDPIP